ncbi:embryo-specific protein ATS3B-like isoform X2 [Vicia villosa]|uniref:embryo-specific protein ATS3B-like isoform X2 n=1 Tax=Vicia villosa TaxID=3911 RepID=UPI00273AC85E|nr:embryo-specific protein ATS3B-like isoform X2 [Vicia villosa]
MKYLTLILTFSIINVFSNATPIFFTRLQPQMSLSYTFNLTHQHINMVEPVRNCFYMIQVKTSCNSPALTRDTIVMLNDDSPDIQTFEQCKTLTFELLGNCIGKICKLYVARVGSDGWIPESITAYQRNYPPITFNYNYFIPDDEQRYGFDYCLQQA